MTEEISKHNLYNKHLKRSKKTIRGAILGVDSYIFEPAEGIDPRYKRLFHAANDIRAELNAQNIGFQHSWMCQTQLPVRKLPLQIREWESHNGLTSVRIEAGSAFHPEKGIWIKQPIPAGTKARLMLLHLITSAISNKGRHVYAGRSLTGYLRCLLNRDPNAHDILEVKQQLAALSVATVRFNLHKTQINSSFIQAFDLDWVRVGDKNHLWPECFSLSRDFWESLKGRAVPVDMRAVASLSHSALAMDIYLWLAQRLCRLNQDYVIYWSVLKDQFGRNYSRLRDFRKKFLAALRQVSAVYPEAQIAEKTDINGQSIGLTLSKSAPPIPYIS